MIKRARTNLLLEFESWCTRDWQKVGALEMTCYQQNEAVQDRLSLIPSRIGFHSGSFSEIINITTAHSLQGGTNVPLTINRKNK